MKIFVTGATGFIGKYLVKELHDSGNQVCINLYDNERSPFVKDVEFYKLGTESIENDILFLKASNFDGIIHLASLYLTTHKPEDTIRLIDSNIKFSSYILECAIQAKIKWFINTGTFWQNFENAAYSPVNLYAATKQAFQTISEYYIQTNQITFVTLKLCDTFGPDDIRPKLFSIWYKYAKNEEVLEMSEGDQLMDISYITDIVDAFYLLASHLFSNSNEIANGSIFAVKADIRYTLKQLSVIFEETTKLRLKIIWGGRPYREREVMIPWENGIVVPNWQPKISIQEGIKRCFIKNS